MPRAYSQDLRQPVIEAADSGRISIPKAGRRFEVSASSAIKWMQRRRQLVVPLLLIFLEEYAGQLVADEFHCS